MSVTVHRRFFPAGDFLPEPRFAPEALPALDPLAGRPEVDAFFDLADLADFADFDGLADESPDSGPGVRTSKTRKSGVEPDGLV